MRNYLLGAIPPEMASIKLEYLSVTSWLVSRLASKCSFLLIKLIHCGSINVKNFQDKSQVNITTSFSFFWWFDSWGWGETLYVSSWKYYEVPTNWATRLLTITTLSYMLLSFLLTLFFRVKFYCNLIWFSHAFNIKEEHNFRSLEMFSGTVPLELGESVKLCQCFFLLFYSFANHILWFIFLNFQWLNYSISTKLNWSELFIRWLQHS